jgi:hypothetical protein
MLGTISAATLSVQYQGQSYDAALTDPAKLAELAALLSVAEDMGGPMAGCPFTATLTLLLADGQKVELFLATDSCCVYRVNNRDYAYARHLYDPYEGSPENSVLFGLFGMNVEDLWAR